MEFIIGMVIGGLIAWQFPQPEWSKNLIVRLKRWWATF